MVVLIVTFLFFKPSITPKGLQKADLKSKIPNNENLKLTLLHSCLLDREVHGMIYVKVEPRSTFTFTRGFSYIASILIYARKAS